MPRARNNQPIQHAPGGEYGSRQASEQAQAQMPLPDIRRDTDQGIHEAAVAGATAMPPIPPGGLFNQPSMRPAEPGTAGLPIGPGPGPEAIRQSNVRRNRTQQQLELAAEITGNPKLAEMAQRTRRPIGRQLPRGRPG